MNDRKNGDNRAATIPARDARTSAATRIMNCLRLPVVLFVFGALLFFSHSILLPHVGRFLVADGVLVRADAVLPLAGELQRVTFAANLVRSGHARFFIITPLPLSSATEKDANVRQVRDIALRHGVSEDLIMVVPDSADSTYGEALNVRRFLETHGLESLLVTTSPWHTRRSSLIFDDVFRSSGVSAEIVAIPDHVYEQPHQAYRPEAWWTSPLDRHHTASEYLKLVAYMLGVR